MTESSSPRYRARASCQFVPMLLGGGILFACATLGTMPTCDVLGCTEFSVTTVSAPGVEGGRLNICDSHLLDLESGATYTVDVRARKIVLHDNS